MNQILRMVKFKISAIQDSEQILTRTIADTQANIASVKTPFLESVLEFFNDAYQFTQGPLAVVNKLINTVDDGINIINTAKKSVQAVASYQQSLNRMLDRSDQLVFSASDLGNEFNNLVGFGTDVFDPGSGSTAGEESPALLDAETQLLELQNSADDNLIKVDLDDPNTIIQSFNLLTSVGYLGGLFANVEYESKNQADELANILYGYIDFIISDDNLPTDLKGLANDLRSAIFTDVSTRTSGLGSVYEYKISDESVPSLVVSNSIYGDIEQEQDIIDRNKIQIPFFTSDTVSVVVPDE